MWVALTSCGVIIAMELLFLGARRFVRKDRVLAFHLRLGSAFDTAPAFPRRHAATAPVPVLKTLKKKRFPSAASAHLSLKMPMKDGLSELRLDAAKSDSQSGHLDLGC